MPVASQLETVPVVGLGDQLRASFLLLRLAATHRRLLEIRFSEEGNATRYLRPAPGGIDWAPRPPWLGPSNAVVVEQRTFWRTDFERLGTQLAEALAQPASAPGGKPPHIVAATTFPVNDASLAAPLLGTAWAAAHWPPSSAELHCMWGALFEPTEELERLRAAALVKLFDPRPPPARFAAVHLRLGGFEGEWRALHRFGAGCDTLALLAAHACGARLAAQLAREDGALVVGGAGGGGAAASGQPPFLFLSDSDDTRHAVATGQLAGAVGPSHFAVHVTAQLCGAGGCVDPLKDVSVQRGVAGAPALFIPPRFHVSLTSRPTQVLPGPRPGVDLESAFVELALLAAASCLVHAKSGYSDVAAWWGGQTCGADIVECMEDYKRALGHPQRRWIACPTPEPH